MGISNLAKKGLRFGNSIMPHTWVLGKKASMGMDLGGQVAGAYDDQYKPTDIEAAPSPINDAEAYTQRDRVRRVAKKAQGVSSTIRTGGTGAPYTGAPATLLGG